MKSLLVALHRYLGAGLCLLFAVWFASGIILIFTRFPRLDPDRRLAALPVLALDPALPSPAEAFARAPIAGRIRLGMLGTRPVYRFVDGGDRAGLRDARAPARAVMVDDDALARLAAAQGAADTRAIDQAAALSRTARPPHPAAQEGAHDDVQVHEIHRRDQWTTTFPADAQFPLRRFDAGDAAAHQIYVSRVTAEVVQDTTRHARTWAWLGAIPHWIYPIALRRHAQTWRRLVMVLAGCGVALCLSGLALGLWHWRPVGRGFPGRGGVRSAIPYRQRWMRWHHIVGLAFGGLAFSWVGSGALSLNPFRWSSDSSPDVEEMQAFSGGPLALGRFVLRPERALSACRRAIQPRELELLQVGGRPYYLCRQSSRDTMLVAADLADIPTSERSRTLPALRALSPEAALAAGAALWSGGPPIDVTRMGHGDAYVDIDDGAPADDDDDDDDDGNTGSVVVPLLLRVRAGDQRAVWTYIDLRTGTLLARLTPAARLERWLYRGLHCLDLPPLGLRPHTALWYLVIVGSCVVGLFFSLTGLMLALGWLARLRRRRAGAAVR